MVGYPIHPGKWKTIGTWTDSTSDINQVTFTASQGRSGIDDVHGRLGRHPHGLRNLAHATLRIADHLLAAGELCSGLDLGCQKRWIWNHVITVVVRTLSIVEFNRFSSITTFINHALPLAPPIFEGIRTITAREGQSCVSPHRNSPKISLACQVRFWTSAMKISVLAAAAHLYPLCTLSFFPYINACTRIIIDTMYLCQPWLTTIWPFHKPQIQASAIKQLSAPPPSIRDLPAPLAIWKWPCQVT